METRDNTGTADFGLGLVVGHLDRDALLDVAYIAWTSSIFLNQGNGRSEVAWTSPSRIFVEGAALVDLDLDGDLDAVGVSRTADPLVLMNDSNGRFTQGSASPFFVGPPPMGRLVITGDWDGDQRADLLVTGASTEQPLLFLRDGSGRFVDVTTTHLPTIPEHIHDVEVRDLDGDGDVDIVAAVINGYDRVLLNEGTGRFGEVPLRGPIGAHVTVALLDLNRDGLQEIFIGGYRTASHLWLNAGGGLFLDFSNLVSHMSSVVEAVGGDVDSDGRDDLLLIGGSPQSPIQLYRNVGGQALALVNNGVRHPPTFAPFSLYLRDMDGDRDLDALGASPSYNTNMRYWFIPNTTRHVETTFPARIGTLHTITLWGYPGQWVLPMISLRGARFDLGSLGVLGLDPTAMVTLPAHLLTSRTHAVTFLVPPGSLGVRLFTQALIVDPRVPEWTRLTNWMDDVIVR